MNIQSKYKNTINKYLPVVILSISVFTIQIFLYLVGLKYYLTQLTVTAYYSMVIIGLSMLMGYAGQISLGHAGFFAIGGYTTAVLTTINLTEYTNYKFVIFLKKIGVLIATTNFYGKDILYFSPWIALLSAIFVTVLIAIVIGTPVLKLKGHYLAMATLGFGIIINKIVTAFKIFGQADGISDVPPFTILPGISVSSRLNERILNYYLAWILVIFGVFILTNLIHSRVGRALRALHKEEAASAMGINVNKYKLNIFILSAVFSAVGGLFLTHYNRGISPSEASVFKSIRYLAIVAIGGMENLWGALVIGVILEFLSLRGVFGVYDEAVFGLILIFMMLFSSNGLNISYKSLINSLIKKWRKNGSSINN